MHRVGRLLTTLEKKRIYSDTKHLPEFTAGRTGKLRVVLVEERRQCQEMTRRGMQFKKELFYVSMTDIHALSQAKVVKKVRRAPDVKGGKQERQADRSDLNPIRFHISIYTADNKKKTSMLSFSLFFFSLRLHALHQLPLSPFLAPIEARFTLFTLFGCMSKITLSSTMRKKKSIEERRRRRRERKRKK